MNFVMDDDDFKDAKDPMEKLDTVMTKAKETGMRVDQMFKHFELNRKGEITRQSFENALNILGGKNFSHEDIVEIFGQIDDDGGGTIDLDEFKHYCYRIPRVAWKAERIRYEREKELERERAKNPQSVLPPLDTNRSTPSPPSSPNENMPPNKSSPQALPAITLAPNSPKSIYNGMKFFWRSQEKVDIMINEFTDHNCFVISSFNVTAGKEYPPIFVNPDAISIKEEEVTEQTEAKMQEQEIREGRPRDWTEAEEAEIRDAVKIDLMSAFLQLRLQLIAPDPQSEEKQLCLVKLALDALEVSELLIQNPGITKIPRFEYPEGLGHPGNPVDLDLFHNMNRELREMASGMSKLSKSAEKMSSIIGKAMQPFGSNPNSVLSVKGVKSKTKKAFIRGFRRHEVEKMRARLATMPEYRQYL